MIATAETRASEAQEKVTLLHAKVYEERRNVSRPQMHTTPVLLQNHEMIKSVASVIIVVKHRGICDG